VTQLAAAGIGELILRGFQRLDRDNRWSSDVPTWLDLWLQVSKLAIDAQKSWWLNRHASSRQSAALFRDGKLNILRGRT